MDLKTFVQNRVAKILYPNQLWRRVPSDQNPADLVSRGVDPDKLLQQNLWFVENLIDINRVAGPLTTKEFEKAETFLVKKVQEQELSSDMNHLKGKGSVLPNSKLKTLNSFLDDNGVLRDQTIELWETDLEQNGLPRSEKGNEIQTRRQRRKETGKSTRLENDNDQFRLGECVVENGGGGGFWALVYRRGHGQWEFGYT
ncbi:hypothetical protein TNCV_3437961 [Trichonephila clavipes]|nr:hypothetical protein TNCV_3437961 [Trichonephila clavipes]